MKDSKWKEIVDHLGVKKATRLREKMEERDVDPEKVIEKLENGETPEIVDEISENREETLEDLDIRKVKEQIKSELEFLERLEESYKKSKKERERLLKYFKKKNEIRKKGKFPVLRLKELKSNKLNELKEFESLNNEVIFIDDTNPEGKAVDELVESEPKIVVGELPDWAIKKLEENNINYIQKEIEPKDSRLIALELEEDEISQPKKITIDSLSISGHFPSGRQVNLEFPKKQFYISERPAHPKKEEKEKKKEKEKSRETEGLSKEDIEKEVKEKNGERSKKPEEISEKDIRDLDLNKMKTEESREQMKKVKNELIENINLIDLKEEFLEEEKEEEEKEEEEKEEEEGDFFSKLFGGKIISYGKLKEGDFFSKLFGGKTISHGKLKQECMKNLRKAEEMGDYNQATILVAHILKEFLGVKMGIRRVLTYSEVIEEIEKYDIDYDLQEDITNFFKKMYVQAYKGEVAIDFKKACDLAEKVIKKLAGKELEKRENNEDQT